MEIVVRKIFMMKSQRASADVSLLTRGRVIGNPEKQRSKPWPAAATQHKQSSH
jgi:hypothetical protein